jgi:hypothetical protein
MKELIFTDGSRFDCPNSPTIEKQREMRIVEVDGNREDIFAAIDRGMPVAVGEENLAAYPLLVGVEYKPNGRIIIKLGKPTPLEKAEEQLTKEINLREDTEAALDAALLAALV